MPLVQPRRVVSSLPLGSSSSAYTTKTTPRAARQLVLKATPSTTAITPAQHSGKTPIQKPQPLNATSACQRQTMSTTGSSDPPFLIRFFHPTHASPDSQGRTLQDILHWPDRNLELSHDYIQTVFPLPEGSMFNSAPLVTPEVRDAFLAQPELAASLRGAFQRILKFYGLETFSDDGDSATGESAGLEVKRGPNFASASRNWITRFNHNHLRLTRILRSLRVLGLSEEAKALHSFLCTDELVASSVSSRSQMYWRRAAERELRLPPDEEDEDAQGIEWLKGQF